MMDPAHPSGVRVQVDMFLASSPRHELDKLSSLAGGFCGIRTVERRIEGKMSIISRVFRDGRNSGHPSPYNPNMSRSMAHHSGSRSRVLGLGS